VGRELRRFVVLAGCLGAGFGAIAVPAAAAVSPAAGPSRVAVSVPIEVTSDASAVATGRVTSFEGRGKVQLQSRRAGYWRPLSAATLRHGRFRIPFVLGGSETVSVRAALLAGGRLVASSPVKLIRVRGATVLPPPAPLPTPSVTSAVAPQPPEPPAEPPSPNPVYWGAWIGPQLTGTPAPEDMGAVTKFEELTKKPLSILETFSSWASCPGSSPTCQPTAAFPRPQFEAMRGYGAIPLYSWASEGTGEAAAQPEFQLADIISGKFDPYIRKWAGEAKAWGHPFFLRFDWEMNGNWFPWSESVDGNQPGEYVTAWRHVYDIFTEVGATNAGWVWCPYVNPNGNLQSPVTLYPGDAYVDWTCLDGYNRGTTASPTAPYRSFDYLFGANYREITESVAPTKPMLLGEIATSEHGGSKAQWIEDMFAALPTAYPKVRAMLWFDYYDQGNDWPLETSAAATAAFAAGISDPRYLPNSFATTTTGPVPLP
jgi:Glycosyl hydrolase family 26